MVYWNRVLIARLWRSFTYEIFNCLGMNFFKRRERREIAIGHFVRRNRLVNIRKTVQSGVDLCNLKDKIVSKIIGQDGFNSLAVARNSFLWLSLFSSIKAEKNRKVNNFHYHIWWEYRNIPDIFVSSSLLGKWNSYEKVSYVSVKKWPLISSQR